MNKIFQTEPCVRVRRGKSVKRFAVILRLHDIELLGMTRASASSTQTRAADLASPYAASGAISETEQTVSIAE